MRRYENIDINKLIPYKNNARTHSKEQVNKIAKSIKEFGFINPVIIDSEFNIIAGHGRILGAKKLGLEKVPCLFVADLTEAQKRAYILADNKLALDAGWDKSILEVELKELKDLDFDITLTGFELFDDSDISEDNFDKELPEESITKLGDVYNLGNHRLMCGDSTVKSNVDKLMDGNKVDMVFTDAPYGMGLDTDFSSMEGIAKGNIYSKVIGDNSDFSPDLINTVFDNFGYCKEIFLWGGDYFAELIPDRNKGSWIVWDKMQNGEGVNDAYDKMFGSNFELCWSKAKHKRALARVLWKGIFGLSKEDTKSRIHPTQKPLELIKWFFDKFKGDKVVDLYGGSGSTLIACEKLNRICFMMELDPRYCDLIVARWENLTGKKAELIRR